MHSASGPSSRLVTSSTYFLPHEGLLHIVPRTTGMVRSSSWLSILNLQSGVIYVNTIFDTCTAVVAGAGASVFKVVVVVSSGGFST